MRILISNDDGILAPGLAALWAASESLGVTSVVAPDSPQSAAGHAITVHHPLAVKRLTVPCEGREFLGISVDGRPADCVRLAIRMLLSAPPDLVLSGINEGANVGINVFYSGTVAAAAEAAMFGIPAVAFSASNAGGKIDYARASALCRGVLDQLIANGLLHGDLINVNIPALDKGDPKGIRVVPQSTAGMEDTYTLHGDDPTLERYKLGDKYSFHPQADSDVEILNAGYITVTPLHVDMTNHDRLVSLARRAWK